MADYPELQSPVTNREKIKTPFATVIVGGTLDKPCYSIMYFEAGEMHIGFSSYNLAYVRQWLSEEFEADSSDAGVAPVVYGRWTHLGGDEWCCPVCGFVITTEGSWDKPAKSCCKLAEPGTKRKDELFVR